MRILAIDTALANCAVAVLDNGCAVPCYFESEEEIGRGHAERLLTMISEVMVDSSTAFNDLDRVAVTTGPGSFTGLRVGLSVAKGFGLVLDKPVVGISTLAAIANTVASAQSMDMILVALEGKGEEVYCQFFDGAGLPLGVASVRRIGDLCKDVSPDTCLAGSAAPSIAQALGVEMDHVVSEVGYPRISAVARLGLSADPRVAVAEPLYLRPPDAAPQKKGMIERQ